MVTYVPYCGTAPLPGTLLTRFNLDPILIGVLLLLAIAHLWRVRGQRVTWFAAAGWATVALALLSPLCALSVSLFAARISQHMLLLLVAAPLLALALPPLRAQHPPLRTWIAGLAFLLALWFWHMPQPYEATFRSDAVYWLMHLTLFGSGLALWQELLSRDRQSAVDRLIVAALTSMQMGLLGAVLAMATHPFFPSHFTTTQVWGLTPLEDQQLGGVIMWVPGIALFLWASVRGVLELRERVDDLKKV